MSIILAITEIKDGVYRKTSHEVVSEAKRLADKNGGQVCALVISAGSAAEPAELGKYGADRVLVADSAQLENYHGDYYKQIVVEACKKVGATLLLFAATGQGKDLAPRVAAKLKAALASDCTAVGLDGDNLVVEKPLYAGKIFARAALTGAIQMASLRPNVFGIDDSAGKTANLEKLELPSLESAIVVNKVDKKESDKPDVIDADIIVTGGRGVRSAENFNIIEELAASLNGAVGATRAAVDSGWRPHSDQVGQTGKVVSPTLYIMCGASGSIQHWAGMSGSKCIVAINKDPNAPIMSRADYAVVGDLFEVVPAMTEEVKQIRD